MKEIAGIGSYCISEQAPPERLWKYDGVCMFDAPGGVIGVAQGVVENNPVVGLIQLTSFAFTVATDEETQDGLIEACKHPIKTAQGIYETKKDQYINNDDIEVTYYHAGLDGVTIIFAVLSGGASVLNYVKGLSKKAKESATKMADELDGINTNRGSPDYDALYDELKELEFTDTPNNPTDVAKEFFENVVHEVGELHWHKFQFPNERMIRIWDKVRTNNDIDFNAVFKKMPNNTSHEFYDKFFEVTMDGDAFLEVPINGNMVVVAEELLKDLSNGGSEFIDNFIGNSGLFDAWETLFEKPVFRANLSKLSSLSEDFVALPELENFLKTNLQKIDHWIDFDDYIKSRDASYWAEFNNPPSNLTLVRERAIKAFTKYPDEYTNAFESLGRPKSDLFTRHGVDYGDEFYDIINDFNSNNTFGLSESEIYSIFGYTTNFFYKDLNYWLREGINPNLTQDMKNLITSGLTKLPSWSDDIAFRGIKIKPPNVQQQIDDILARYPEGTNVLHGEFVSVGSSPEASFLYNPEVKFRVEFNLKPNTKAKDVSSLADGVMYQGNPISELLFPPGLDIHVDVVSLPDPEGVITMFFTEL